MDSFEFQLVVTERCNLSCTYCYMNKNAIDMSVDVFESHYKMLPKIMDDYGAKFFKLVFFGGEPLLAFDLVEHILKRVEKDNKCQFKIMVTNGLLLDEYKQNVLNSFNVPISLSFDGIGNKDCRPLNNGRSSLELYEKDNSLLNNLIKRNQGSKVMIPPERSYTLLENYNWFLERGCRFPDFSLVRDFWSDEAVIKFKKEIKDLTNAIIHNIKSGEATLAGFYKLVILDLIFGESYGKRPFGCFAGCHGAGFLPDGKVYPCARFGSNKSSVLYDSVKEISFESNINNIKQLSKTHDYEKCKKCQLFKYCNMGCSYSQIQNGNQPLDCICNLYFIIYEEAMRMVEELKDNVMFKELVIKFVKETN